MDMYKLKFTRLQNEIFRLSCIKSGTSLNQREISRILKVSPTAVAKALPELVKECLIKLEKGKVINLNSIELNRNSQKALLLKKVENLKMVYESGLADFLEDKFPGATLILFGSYSRGDDTEKSDIDIAIVGVKEKEVDLVKFEKLLERRIIINFYSALKDVHKDLRENICNGTVLVGGVQF